MIVQPISNQNYNNYQIKSRNNSMNFKGKFGENVLKKVESCGYLTKEHICSEVLVKLNIATFGMVSLGNVADILEAVMSQNIKLKREYREELEKSESAYQEKTKTLEEEFQRKKEELNAQISGKQSLVDKKEKELAQKQTQLEDKEKALINTENMLNQLEVNRIKSAMRTFYNIEDSEITSYDSIGEQCLQISSVFSDLKNVNISNLDSTALQELAIAMQNKDGCFTAEAMTFLERIAGMHNFNINDLITTMYLVKDPLGNIDMEKSTHFIALYSLNNSDMNSVNEDLAKYYVSPLEKYSISDAQILFKLIGVQSEINKEGLVVKSSLDFDPNSSNTLCNKCNELNINLNELLKYVVEAKYYFNVSNNEQVTVLNNLKYIGGFGGFYASPVTELPNLVSVGKNLDIRCSKITGMPLLESIGGDGLFQNSPITDLRSLRSIKQCASYGNSPLQERQDWLSSIANRIIN